MLLCLCLAAAAFGGEGPREPWFEEEEAPPRSVTLSLAPMALLTGPTLEGMAELRAGPNRSLAITASRPLGVARAPLYGDEGPQGEEVGPVAGRPPMELGLQVREYVAGDFSTGLALGAGASFKNPSFREMRADSTTFGPFFAIKMSASLFTIEARGGPAITIDPKGLQLAPKVDFAAGISF
jgi:hypothetical protein